MSRKTVLLLTSYYAFIVIGLKPGVLNIAWEHIEATFALSLDALGVLLTFGTVGHLLSAFVSGRVLSTLSMGMFLLIGSLLSGLGALGFILSPVWSLLLLAVLISSIGSGMIDAGLNTFASANYDVGKLNWLHAFFGLGSTIGPLVVSVIVIDLGQSWRLSYVFLLLLQLVLASAILVNLRHWKINTQDVEDDGQPRAAASMWESLRSPIVLFSILFFVLYGGVEIGAGQLANTLFTDARGVPPDTASYWVSIYWGSFTVGRMLIGLIVSRIGTRRLMRLSMIGMVIGAALFGLNINNTLSFFGLAFLGFALAPMFPTLIAETPRRVTRRHAPNAIGFQVGITGFGGAILPGVAGLLSDSFGLNIIGILIAISAVLVFVLYEFMLYWESQRVIAAVNK